MDTSSNRSLLTHHLLWGVALGAAVVLATQILTWLGLGLSHLTWISTWLLVAVFAALGGRSLGRRVGGRPRFLQAVLLLIVMILVSKAMYQTYMYLYISFVDPTWVDTVAEVWGGQLREMGTPADQIDRQIASFRGQWETRNVFTIGLVSFTLPQFVLGLISVVLAAVQPWKRAKAA